jgi:glutamate/tyrosine decarboxylase-like PLP-dependent enzyme
MDVAKLLAEAAARGQRYVQSVESRPVGSVADLSAFDGSLPEDPCDPMDTVALLDDAGSPGTVASTGPRYFGFVTGGTLPVALAAGWLGMAWDQNTALPVMSPVAAKLHSVTSHWLADLLGLPATAVFVSGASMANATALSAARDRQLARAGWDAQADGLFGAPPITVVVGGAAHSTLTKALGMVGLGRDRVHRVPCDSQGRMVASELPDIQGPIIVCAQAGEVNTGAFDPVPEIVSWARDRDAWLHVDGAFGLWALADPALSHLTRGLADFDSWATDAHKWLNVSYDSGIVFVRDPADLRRSFAASAGYLPADNAFEAMHHTPQSSQRARQIEIWAVLRTLGRSGLRDLIARGCLAARQIADGLRHELTVVNDVVLNQVVVSAHDDETTARLIAAVQADGTCWCGPTSWHGRHAMRISVSGWNTTKSDVDATVEAILRCAREVG